MTTIFAALLFFFQSLPSGEAVIAKYVEVTGGKAAYDKVHSTISTGTVAMPSQGISGKVTMYEADPDKNYTVVDIPGIGLVEDGTDGTVAWEKSALQGARLKTGAEKAYAIRSANSQSKFKELKKFYKSVETVGVENVNGKPCYKVVSTPIEGAPEVSYYDKASGLLIKETGVMASPMGDVPVETEIGDYRKEGALFLPHKVKQSFVGQTMEITLDTTKLNPEIPKDRFDVPADVKALIK